jgi:uncharacterized membrane protein YccC
MTRDLVFGLVAIFPVLFFYQFALLPRLDGFPALALSLFPVLVPLGVASNLPKYTLKVLGMLAGFSAGLALQPVFNSDLATLLNLYLAVVVGALAALAVIALLRVIPTERAIARIKQAGWREMAAHARNQAAVDGRDLVSRMVDRLGLLVPRLQAIQSPESARTTELLRDVSQAHALVELGKLRGEPQGAVRPEIDAALLALAAHFDRLATTGEREPSTQLVDGLDAAVARILRLDAQTDRRAGISALATLRNAILPARPVPA